MSGQMSDVIVVGDDEFAIIEPPNPEELFDVRSHGVKPVMLHTANTRGVSARYRVVDDQLFLSELQVGSVEAPPEIQGVAATTDEHGQTWTYLDLDLPIPFSGDLVVGSGPILDLYVHSGFLPAWHYERVLALSIDGGAVQSQQDRSAEVAQYRAEKTGADANADGGADEDEGSFEKFLSSIMTRLGLDD